MRLLSYGSSYCGHFMWAIPVPTGVMSALQETGQALWLPHDLTRLLWAESGLLLSRSRSPLCGNRQDAGREPSSVLTLVSVCPPGPSFPTDHPLPPPPSVKYPTPPTTALLCSSRLYQHQSRTTLSWPLQVASWTQLLMKCKWKFSNVHLFTCVFPNYRIHIWDQFSSQMVKSLPLKLQQWLFCSQMWILSRAQKVWLISASFSISFGSSRGVEDPLPKWLTQDW